jgi:peptide/nickel transport system permease protein
MATDTQSQTESEGAQVPPIVRELLANRRILIGLLMLLPIVVMAVLGKLIAPYDPTATHVAYQYDGPSEQFLLGTDHLGRDLLSRIIVGARTTLLIGFGSVALATRRVGRTNC